MPPERDPARRSSVPRFNVVAEPVATEAWHLTVRELPSTWTVAFARGDIERRARERIALDLGIEPAEMDIVIHHLAPRRYLL
jgi:hypothetical protein